MEIRTACTKPTTASRSKDRTPVPTTGVIASSAGAMRNAGWLLAHGIMRSATDSDSRSVICRHRAGQPVRPATGTQQIHGREQHSSMSTARHQQTARLPGGCRHLPSASARGWRQYDPPPKRDGQAAVHVPVKRTAGSAGGCHPTRVGQLGGLQLRACTGPSASLWVQVAVAC